MGVAAPSEVSAEQRALLERWVRAHGTPQSIATRARVVLMGADGESNSAIARALGISRPTVIMWRRRFAEGGPQALSEVKEDRGRKRSISAQKVKLNQVVTGRSAVPRLSHLRVRPDEFPLAIKEGRATSATAWHGTVISYRDTLAAHTNLHVLRKLRGVRRGRRCAAAAKGKPAAQGEALPAPGAARHLHAQR